MDRTKEINVRLYEKLCGEYNDFYEKLKTLPPDEIIQNSYEKVFKEDILMCFEYDDLLYDKAKALYETDQPLDELYNEWLGTDCGYMDMLRDCIDEREESALCDFKAKNKDMER